MLAYLAGLSVLTLHTVHVRAANNEFQPYKIPNEDPSSWEEIKKVIIEGASDDPNENIHANLEEAMCGGFDFETNVNGVFDQFERYVDRVRNIDISTTPDEGLISKVTGVPGRDTERAYGNLQSGLSERREVGGLQDLERVGNVTQLAATTSGFSYPAEVAGFSTLCRPPSHPDVRTWPPPIVNYGPRDKPGFFCDHACQRPLDTPGKPGNWDAGNSQAVQCGAQQPYEPVADQVKYACGGGQTQGPDGNMMAAISNEGSYGGLCEDLNKWVYILWKKKIGECVVPTPLGPIVVDVNQYEKGHCGFPDEIATTSFDNTNNMLSDNWEPISMYECCSDTEYTSIDFNKDGATNDDGYYEPTGNEIGFTGSDRYDGHSCKVCLGETCRFDPDTHPVILSDGWIETTGGFFPNDVCLAYTVDETYRKSYEDRQYVSYFRDYPNATYERAALDEYVPDDDHKKAKIPVACYGMYDLSPENAKLEQTEAIDKRCTIGAYYEADDGDGDGTNFWGMRDTQKGKANYDPGVADDPFEDPTREFDEEKDIWWPEMGDAFSMLNDKVFEERFDNDFSLVLLATDEARQRTTVQLDKNRKLSSGSVLRTFDDTITIDQDFTKERRTMVEWWHVVETELHKNFTPPTVRMLLPTTWSIDINPLDPIYTPPLPKDESEQSPDPRSETIEVQIQAGEDTLGDIVSYMERNLLLRIQPEPVPVVVPMANPTELRAWAQGWEAWALKQEEQGGPGVTNARKVSAQLLHYADQADNVRALRGELALYAGKLLNEQSKIHKKTAQWLTDNIDAYRNYLVLDWGISLLKTAYQTTQSRYLAAEDGKAFPWCHNERFTSPIYSLLDPWLPGRDVNGDVTGGFGPCLAGADCSALYQDYGQCIAFVISRQLEKPEAWPTYDICDPYLPLPPAFPELPDVERDGDIVIDFTAFKEAQKTVILPVLKPIQIRLDFDRVRPPGLEDNDEPNYPEFIELSQPADLPELPDSITDEVLDSLPSVIIPIGEDFDLFKEAAVLATTEDDAEDAYPKIALPKLDVLGLAVFLFKTHELVTSMAEEYEKFWGSLTLEPCEAGQNTDECIRPGTEQDCVNPYDDPKGRCVHFEGDLKERLQRIGSRPDVLLFEDFLSAGTFRRPQIMGQEYCEREDWACQLLNKYKRYPRDGWQLFVTEDYQTEGLVEGIRKTVREATDNIIEEAKDRFLFDIDQKQIYENFYVPEGERIEQYHERFGSSSSSSS